MLENEWVLAKIGVDTAENGPNVDVRITCTSIYSLLILSPGLSFGHLSQLQLLGVELPGVERAARLGRGADGDRRFVALLARRRGKPGLDRRRHRLDLRTNAWDQNRNFGSS